MKRNQTERSTLKHPNEHDWMLCGAISQLSAPREHPIEKQSSASPRLPFRTTFCSCLQRSWHLVQPAEQQSEAQFSSGSAQLCPSPTAAQSLPSCPHGPAHRLRSSALAGCSVLSGLTALLLRASEPGLAARHAPLGRGVPSSSPALPPSSLAPLLLPTPVLCPAFAQSGKGQTEVSQRVGWL